MALGAKLGKSLGAHPASIPRAAPLDPTGTMPPASPHKDAPSLNTSCKLLTTACRCQNQEEGACLCGDFFVLRNMLRATPLDASIKSPATTYRRRNPKHAALSKDGEPEGPAEISGLAAITAVPTGGTGLVAQAWRDPGRDGGGRHAFHCVADTVEGEDDYENHAGAFGVAGATGAPFVGYGVRPTMAGSIRRSRMPTCIPYTGV